MSKNLSLAALDPGDLHKNFSLRLGLLCPEFLMPVRNCSTQTVLVQATTRVGPRFKTKHSLPSTVYYCSTKGLTSFPPRP